MRTALLTLFSFGALALAGTIYVTGCANSADDCRLTGECCPDGTLSCAATSTGGGGSTSSSTGTGGTPILCIPSESKNPVVDSCGVFVSSSLGADDMAAGRGSKTKPYKTIGAALMKSDVTRVYVCAESFSEEVVVATAVELYGGLDCKSWAYVGATTKTMLTAASDLIPLTLGNAAGLATVEDFALVAAAAKAPGGSSIAVLANGATASLTRCALTSGDASAGDPGVSGGAQAAQAEAGKAGGDAGAVAVMGGGGGQNLVCSLAGGKGGDGGVIGTMSGNGGDGFQGDMGVGGLKGLGQTTTGCTPGGQGDLGIPGPVALGAQGAGKLSATGYQGTDGDAGQDGTHGKSGGGGGGSKASATVHGAGGGGGGAGGCGGKQGTGGKAGGSSLALVSIGAKVTLAGCKLATGKGGAGGKGGDGQFGQAGGDPAFGGKGSGTVVNACAGGFGGAGGPGSNGGGGLGGHSLSLAVTGSVPTLDPATQKAITLGAKGTGGPGGNMDTDLNHGAPGMASVCWDFSSNMACSP